ncbi:MAG: type II toxin-antitoxin system RelE/ParE family toxin [Planctomycetota bacterium]|nr:MAG: type II toxin-antitoxin system RelE/ParE family toxin [Planctomycetota bacterium]
MRHRLVLTRRAEADLNQAYTWWSDNRSPEQAYRWYEGFLQALRLAAQGPDRHPLAAESFLFPYEIRQLNYGLGKTPTHRAVFVVRAGAVLVLRIRHLAQEALGEEDVAT